MTSTLFKKKKKPKKVIEIEYTMTEFLYLCQLFLFTHARLNVYSSSEETMIIGEYVSKRDSRHLNSPGLIAHCFIT